MIPSPLSGLCKDAEECSYVVGKLRRKVPQPSFVALVPFAYSSGHCFPASAFCFGHVPLLWRVLRCPEGGGRFPHRSGPLPHHNQLQQPVALVLRWRRGGRGGDWGRRTRRRRGWSRERRRETDRWRMTMCVCVCVRVYCFGHEVHTSNQPTSSLLVFHIKVLIKQGSFQGIWLTQWWKPPEIVAVMLNVSVQVTFPYWNMAFLFLQ